MFEIVEQLKDYHVFLFLAVIAVILFLIDYFFPTDWPAHLGYLLFAIGMFGLFPWAYLYCAIAAAAVWLTLILLHQFCFRHFLTNAPGTQES